MNYKLFLDDERDPSDVIWCNIGLGPWVIVRNYDQFVKTIKEHGVPIHVSFDHDLADAHYKACFSGSHDYGQEKTGHDCAKWLVHHCARRYTFPKYTIHSMNPIGRENIDNYIKSALRAGIIT